MPLGYWLSVYFTCGLPERRQRGGTTREDAVREESGKGGIVCKFYSGNGKRVRRLI